jgi:hypothetical protein
MMEAMRNMPMGMSIRLHGGDFTGNLPPGFPSYSHAITVTHLGQVNGELGVYFDSSASIYDHSYPSGTPVPWSQFLEALRPENGRHQTFLSPHS